MTSTQPKRSCREPHQRGSRHQLARRTAITLAVLATSLISAGSASAAQTAWPTQQAISDNGRFLAWTPPPPELVGVCIVDSGVNLNPDTESSVVFRTALNQGAPGDVSPDDHGTLMAMFAAAQATNQWGMIGAAPTATRIVSVRVAEPGETGEGLDYFAAGIAECLRYQHPYNIKVISLSLGNAPPETTTPQTSLNQKIMVARNYGVNVLAAAGNDAGTLEYPATAADVLSVGATGSAHQLCGFSSIGASLIAPGCELDGADPQTGVPNTNYSQGTSQATAITADVLGALRAYRPDLTPTEAEQLLTQPDNGTLNVTATFQAAGLQTIIQAGTQAEPTKQPTPTEPTPSPAPTVPPTPPAVSLLPGRLPSPHAQLKRRDGNLLLTLANRPAEAEAQLQLFGRHAGKPHLLRRLSTRQKTIMLPAHNIKVVCVRYIDPYDNTRASAWVKPRMPSSTK